MKENENTTQMSSNEFDINKRFLKVIKDNGYSGYRISKEIPEISESKLTHIRSKRNKPSLEMINAILKKFPNTDRDWLLNGENKIINEVAEERDKLYLQPESKSKPVPYYNIDFAGGWSSEELFTNVKPDFFINNPEFSRSDFACNLVGKSVSDIIPDGSIVGFKVIEDWKTFFLPDELYGIITKNEFRTVKLISRNRQNKTLILKPAPSKEYAERYTETEEIPEDYITKFFQVIAYACFERLVI